MSHDCIVVGMAVMGANLARNLARNGFSVGVWNRSWDKVEAALEAATPAEAANLTGYSTLSRALAQAKSPAIIIVMVQAGKGTDAVISSVLADDSAPAEGILVDGGNAYYPDTIRRGSLVKEQRPGWSYVGCGVSGGELGALYGPSMMPGGDAAAWPALEPLFTAIAAVPYKLHAGSEEAEASGKADDVSTADKCVVWCGPDGSGHYVKMVHNGIEYGDMEVLAEGLALVERFCGGEADAAAGKSAAAAVFSHWQQNDARIAGYLVDITVEILQHPDFATVLDAAGQKGTGRWTAIAGLDAGTPLTAIAEAVFARSLSAQVDERAKVRSAAGEPTPLEAGITSAIPVSKDDIADALFCAKVMCYAQGFELLRAASAANEGWSFDLSAIARAWRGGCIIRCAFLQDAAAAWERNPDLVHLAADQDFFGPKLAQAEPGWRRVVAAAVAAGIPVPVLSSTLSYWDGYRAGGRGPGALIQAQRDYFGAHTYERIGEARGTFYHTNWTGKGGAVASTSYNA